LEDEAFLPLPWWVQDALVRQPNDPIPRTIGSSLDRFWAPLFSKKKSGSFSGVPQSRNLHRSMLGSFAWTLV
jgi:hypothetical protein